MLRNILETSPQEVRILKGGGKISRVGKPAGKTKAGETWIARAVYWGPEEPMLWVIHLTEEGVGAWVHFDDVETMMLPQQVQVDFS